MRIDCHCHTAYSKHWFWGFDALDTPQNMIKVAIKRGLDGLAIVDHNDVKGSIIAKKVAKRYKFMIVNGSEIKTKSGDLIALGIKENVPIFLPLEETIERIHDLGGIAVAPHPFGKYVFRKCIGNGAVKADAIEVFNSTLTPPANIKAMKLSEKFKIAKTAGSDAHSIKEVGNAGIVFDGDPIEAIVKGKVKIFGRRTPLIDSAYLISRKFTRSFEWRLNRSRGKRFF
jgi:predicted metal-dependent phosphoesterase TrpH